MIYSTLLILFGIYVGQEYPVIPSVRLMAIGFLRYIKETNENLKNDNNDDQSVHKSFLENIINKMFFQ